MEKEKIKRVKKPASLKIKLLLVLIPIIVVYTWAITAVNSGYIMDSTKDSLEKTLGQTANITAEHIAESIADNKKLAMLLADRVASQYGTELLTPYSALDVDAFAAEIAELGVEYGFLHMMVAGTDGYTRTALHTNLVEKNADYYTAIMNDGQPSYISDVSVDQGSFKGKYVLNYSAPVKTGDGKIIGVLICKSDAVKLSELVSNISVGESGSTFIMDNSGQCIAHKDEGMLFSGAQYLEYRNNDQYKTLNALWDTMVKQNTGYMVYDLNGPRIAAFSRVAGTNNWSIAVTVAEAEFMKGAIDARNAVTWIGLLMVAFVAVILVLLVRYTTKGIRQVTARLERLADGNLDTELTIDRTSEETYRLSEAAVKFTSVVRNLIHETEYLLSEIAKGNLTVTPGTNYPGDFADLRDAINDNLAKLNGVVQRISYTSDEVARGSTQMAYGATGLAQSASEQAGSLEELFETVTALTQRTYEIGGVDKKKLTDLDDDETHADADSEMDITGTLAEKLIMAITRIADVSGSIRHIASDIESISAKTGMLALNASVEATHAGEAGRGFTVIASEIRNLSDKSREAAQDANRQIDSITRAVNRGTQTVDITVSTIGEMIKSMNEVKGTLEQISNIVESIAATAEETAAGSEELSAQATVMKELVFEFKTKEDNGANRTSY